MDCASPDSNIPIYLPLMSTFGEAGSQLGSLFSEAPTCKLEVKFKIKLMNKLEFTLEVVPHRYRPCSERQHIKYGNFDFVVRIDANETCYMVLIQLHNRYKSTRTDVVQAITISSKKGKIRHKTYFCDDTKWRVLYKENHRGISAYRTDIVMDSEALVLRNPFSSLYEDTELTDFELCAKDGSVGFHSTVLAAASPSLRRMLAGRWVETESRKLKLLNTTKTTLQHLKDYLYIDRLPDEGLEQLLLLATYHLMSDLENDCIEKLICQMTTENSTELARFALSNNLMKLYYAYLRMVRDGVINVSTLQEQEMKLENVVHKTLTM